MSLLYQKNKKTSSWPRKSDIMDKVGWMHDNAYSSPVCPTSKFSLRFSYIIKQKGIEN